MARYVPDPPQPPVAGDMSDVEYKLALVTYGEDEARWLHEYVKDCGHHVDHDCDCDTIATELRDQD